MPVFKSRWWESLYSPDFLSSTIFLVENFIVCARLIPVLDGVCFRFGTAVPKRKQTPSRTGMRRAQTMKFSTKNIVEDKKSGEYRLSHHLDLKTGMYKGRQVLDPKE